MPVELSATEARRLRARSQLLGGSDLDPADVVHRAVALQGQDLAAVQRAIAVRSRSGTTLREVRAAFDAGRLVRSWPMRATLFATTPEHLATLLYFTASRIHRATARRRRELGLDDELVARARELLLPAIAERPLSRAEALRRWQQAGIATGEGRGYHLLLHLAVDGLLHWGPFDESGSEQLLTASRTPAPDDAEAALAGVVRGFVVARGPVTEADLAWWTKLPRTLLRRAVAAVDDLVEVTVEGVPGWLVGDPDPPGPSGVSLLPGFDEWLLGYADRALVAGPAMLEAVVPGRNGVFRPLVLVDGRVVGTWRAAGGPARAPRAAQVELVEAVPSRTARAIDRALAAWPHG